MDFTSHVWLVGGGGREVGINWGAGNPYVKSGLTPLMLTWFNVKMKIV